MSKYFCRYTDGYRSEETAQNLKQRKKTGEGEKGTETTSALKLKSLTHWFAKRRQQYSGKNTAKTPQNFPVFLLKFAFEIRLWIRELFMYAQETCIVASMHT